MFQLTLKLTIKQTLVLNKAYIVYLQAASKYFIIHFQIVSHEFLNEIPRTVFYIIGITTLFHLFLCACIVRVIQKPPKDK